MVTSTTKRSGKRGSKTDKSKRTKRPTKTARGRGRGGMMSPEQAEESGVLTGNGRDNGEALGTFQDDGAEPSMVGPYTVHIEIEGTRPILIHGYNVDLIEWLETLPKGAKEKKRDYPELYCYWNKPYEVSKKSTPPIKKPSRAVLCGATDWLWRAMVEAGKRFTDPSSYGGRKSAKELVEAGVQVLGEDGDIDVTPFYVAPGVGRTTRRTKYAKATTWDYLDKRPVVVNNSRVPRVRPAMGPGWRLRYVLHVTEPELIPVTASGNRLSLRTLVDAAATRQGLGDFRPKFGLFRVTEWDVQDDD